MKKVDVIVPVYRGLHETRECIISATETIDPADGRLIVINDCSPEPELVEWLQSASSKYGFVLLHNDENLGFVATVNRGMQLNEDRDVLLLNSDVEVAGNWLSRMREAAYQHGKLASLTPFSNNATICSFPNFCEDNELIFDLNVKQLDEHFSELYSSHDLVEIPSGVGFCMYIRRDCLESVGYFDVEAFGKGYGEENDWCQRAEKAGWKNFHQMNVFAYHKGGVSFSGVQEPRKVNALKIMSAFHPQYEYKVHSYIQQDPARRYRVEALWKLVAGIQRPKIVHITHRLGGGVQQHVSELNDFYREEALFLQLMPKEDGISVSLSVLHAGKVLVDSLSFQIETEYDQLLSLLRNVGVGRVHFHHTMGLHPRLWAMPADLACGYDFTVHDYFCINGNPTLIDENARYAGDQSVVEMDAACSVAYPIPVSGDQWRQNKKAIVETAERVIFPSQDCYRRFQQFFDASESVVAWHPDFDLAQPYPAPHYGHKAGDPLKVLVLGALSREKGADVLEEVAEKAANCEFHLLGYAYRALNSAVKSYGPYEQKQAKELISEINPDVVWFPVLWPETYSYTLSLVLELGLPAVVPDIGAFSERVHSRAYSWVMPWNQSTQQWVEFWSQMQTGTLAANAQQVFADTDTASPVKEFYQAAYLSKVRNIQAIPEKIHIDALLPHASVSVRKLGRREKILRLLWQFSRLPLVSWLVSLIPFDLRRAVKRRFSSRPIHEILNDSQVG